MENPTYRSWQAMRQRCDNPSNDRWADYGGRGITYPKEWKSFDKFLEDMGERHTPNLTLDRINNSLGYSKANCRWASKVKQSRNIRDDRLNNSSGVKGVSLERRCRWRAEGIYAGKRSRLYQGSDFLQACLARWEWEFVTLYHMTTGQWI